VDALDPDRHEEMARQETGLETPPPEAIEAAARRVIADATKPGPHQPWLAADDRRGSKIA